MRIIACLPGASYSGNFLHCWTALLDHCYKKNFQIMISQQYSPNIYYVRNMCLGADIRRGIHQKPYNGEIDYDYILWIDSDIVFRTEHFDKLLYSNKDIVSGLYLMSDGEQYATVENWDEDYFKKNGYFKFLTPELIKDKKEQFPVAYTGFGFMLIKKGVFENMEYPWFRPEYVQIGNATDFTMEDVGFCLNARKKGYKIFIDPTVIVGHEKKKILI
jgi:GT2 family glycosyltransferase